MDAVHLAALAETHQVADLDGATLRRHLAALTTRTWRALWPDVAAPVRATVNARDRMPVHGDAVEVQNGRACRAPACSAIAERVEQPLTATPPTFGRATIIAVRGTAPDGHDATA
ncbi:hypothetical protein [Mycobacteroides abscessus]|uniref:hypothetical protein n=1 Tax=Mycobacteroides abscessus TaxID=36809 RepID=UPI0012FFF74F|nr:hypothetical protein [Mycobacteroides abscessus]